MKKLSTLLLLSALIPNLSFAGGGQTLLNRLKQEKSLSFSSKDKLCELNLEYRSNKSEYLQAKVGDWWIAKVEHTVTVANHLDLLSTVNENSLEVHAIAEGKITSIIIETDENGNPSYVSYSSGHSSLENGTSLGGCFLNK